MYSFIAFRCLHTYLLCIHEISGTIQSVNNMKKTINHVGATDADLCKIAALLLIGANTSHVGWLAVMYAVTAMILGLYVVVQKKS